MIQKYRELGKLKIGWDEWSRFEEMSDKDEFLWDMFWTIAGDKKELAHHKICKRGYFEVYVIPKLIPRLRGLSIYSIVRNINDFDIILSLFLQLIPDRDCENCNCEQLTSEINEYIR